MKKTYSIVLLVLAVALAVAGGVCASALYRERMARARLRVEQARLCLIPPTAGKSFATNSAAATGDARTCAISAPLRAGRSSCCRWWRKIRAWRQFD